MTAAIQTLLPLVVESAPAQVVRMLSDYPDEFIVAMLQMLNPAMAQDVLQSVAPDRRQKIMAAAAPETRRQWMRNEIYGEDTVGHMMEPPLAVYSPETTIAEATSDLRLLSKRAFITYLWVVDSQEHLLGVVVMREMLLSENPNQRLEEIMIRNPFHLRPDMTLTAAMKETVVRHFPIYPVCDGERKLVGLLRGQMLSSRPRPSN